jgi:hypothetical protein
MSVTAWLILWGVLLAATLLLWIVILRQTYLRFRTLQSEVRKLMAAISSVKSGWLSRLSSTKLKSSEKGL